MILLLLKVKIKQNITLKNKICEILDGDKK